MAACSPQPNLTPLANRRAPANLATLFRAGYMRDDAPTIDLWRRHDQGDAQADELLFEHYAPCCFVHVMILKKRHPDYFIDSIDDMISDAALGLLNAIRLNKFGPLAFRKYAKREIRKMIYREKQTRRWGGRRGCEKANVINAARGKLTAELGRLPSAEELHDQLRGLVTNPNIAVHGEPRMSAASETNDGSNRIDPVSREAAPAERAIEREMLELARGDMDPIDFAMVRTLLDGVGTTDIARRFRLDERTARKRLNGALWLLKKNAALAEALEVDPALAKPRVSMPRFTRRPIHRPTGAAAIPITPGQWEWLERLLNPTEAEMVRMYLEGNGRREIASRFTMSASTVRDRINAALWKLKGDAAWAAHVGFEPMSLHGQGKPPYLNRAQVIALFRMGDSASVAGASAMAGQFQQAAG